MREIRACIVCITHYSLEYIGDLEYPTILEIQDAYILIKGGKRRGRREPPRPEMTPEMQHAFDRAMAQENREAHRNKIPVSQIATRKRK